MDRIIRSLLEGKEENHILPFFWQHGEDEATLREYMAAIEGANCRAVCVESRPHPDFCGPKWWEDMDIILDEARKRDMKVWILDDSHFPTGFANGAVKDAPLALHRQSLCANRICFNGPAQEIALAAWEMIPPEFKPANMMEQYVMPALLKETPHFEDDRILAVTAVCEKTGEAVSLPLPDKGERLRWQKPEGEWSVWVMGLSRNCGPHREYINMLDPDSCHLLIDAVYEPHYARYGADFGKTIAGFFSDEPELGNGHLYFYENFLGTDQDLPFADTMPSALAKHLGEDWKGRLYHLWSNEGDGKEIAKVRHAYMDAVTKLLRESFSRQLGDWCRARGVRYIGHMIEDGNAHARTGSSLGHYFRGLDGQDMAGIDDIGGQVLPQGEDEPKTGNLGTGRDGEFYHYMLGNLAASAAAVEPGKRGNAMCEIFGNYGWAEGVQLEKYLADHFMVRGINHFVPHAFSPAPFPDSDCPPHFYAHGHNPQYRHFGALMKYMNRVCTLISGGHRKAEVAVLYHGEAEWAGGAMLTQKAARPLTEAQIAFDTIPADVFAEPEHYRTRMGNPLKVNSQEYQAFVIPESQYLTRDVVLAADELSRAGLPVFFINRLPQGVCDGDDALLERLGGCKVVKIEDLVPSLQQTGIGEVRFEPENLYLRVLHYFGEAECYYFVNEAAEVYEGVVTLSVPGSAYCYDAWENRVYPAVLENGRMKMALEPGKSLILIVDKAAADDGDEDGIKRENMPEIPDTQSIQGKAAGQGWMPVEAGLWKRSVCKGIDYPHFGEAKTVTMPDHLAEEQPAFSGYVAYESCFILEKAQALLLEITDACEGVEVFVNGRSAGIQIVPPYRYDLSKLAQTGENLLRIEVATTLERYCYDLMKDDMRMKLRGLKAPTCGSGITGEIRLSYLP